MLKDLSCVELLGCQFWRSEVQLDTKVTLYFVAATVTVSVESLSPSAHCPATQEKLRVPKSVDIP